MNAIKDVIEIVEKNLLGLGIKNWKTGSEGLDSGAQWASPADGLKIIT